LSEKVEKQKHDIPFGLILELFWWSFAGQEKKGPEKIRAAKNCGEGPGLHRDKA